MDIDNIRTKINNIQNELKSEFVERDDEIQGLALSILANANIFLLGPPGVGKSLLVSSWQKRIFGAKSFSYLLSQFTVPEELAGPISLKKLQEDKFVRNSSGMLTEAHLGFLDEIWKGNSGVLNFLLPILNERIVYSEGKSIKLPLLTLVGASNETPEGSDLAAAFDRFTLKYDVKGVADKENYMKMMKNYLSVEEKSITTITLDEIIFAKNYLYLTKFPDSILRKIYKIVNALRSIEGIEISARLVNQSLRVIQAYAFLNGNEVVQDTDLLILQNIFWKTKEERCKVLPIIFKHVKSESSRAEQIYKSAIELYHSAETSSSAAIKTGLQQKIEELNALLQESDLEKEEEISIKKYLIKTADLTTRFSENMIQDDTIFNTQTWKS